MVVSSPTAVASFSLKSILLPFLEVPYFLIVGLSSEVTTLPSTAEPVYQPSFVLPVAAVAFSNAIQWYKHRWLSEKFVGIAARREGAFFWTWYIWMDRVHHFKQYKRHFRKFRCRSWYIIKNPNIHSHSRQPVASSNDECTQTNKRWEKFIQSWQYSTI